MTEAELAIAMKQQIAIDNLRADRGDTVAAKIRRLMADGRERTSGDVARDLKLNGAAARSALANLTLDGTLTAETVIEHRIYRAAQ